MKEEYTLAVPMAGALTSSLRSFPYSSPTAVADIIDNSISAGAENIDITFHWDGADSYVLISDDGAGMTAQELITAMTIGSIHPEEVRDDDDLGRFGLGMKTASFSQCRNLTVYSQIKRTGKNTQSTSIARWDLDELRSGKWKLLHYPNDEAKSIIEAFKPKSSGTLIIWQNLDRLIDIGLGDKPRAGAKDDFWRVGEDVERHIALTFHRFMTPTRGSRSLKIFINGRQIKPLDPFLSSNEATQIKSTEYLSLGHEDRRRIEITPYILPHQRDQRAEDSQNGSLIDGWNAHQGFYIYRNDRLLVSGQWMRLWSQEDHYKLARIRVDIPNNLDEEFQIDVVKARATIPAVLRADFRRIGTITRSQATEVYRQRGQVVSKSRNRYIGNVWKKSSKKGLNAYKLDRKHPLIDELLSIETKPSKDLETVFRIIEETVPIETIYIDKAEDPDRMSGPLEALSEPEILDLIQRGYDLLIRSNLLDTSEALAKLRITEPFDMFPEQLSEFADGILEERDSQRGI